MTFTSKFTVGQVLSFIKNDGTVSYGNVTSVVFTKEEILYELDNDLHVSEHEVADVYVKQSIVIQETNQTELEGITHV